MVGYENIVDAGSTFRVYWWGNMLAAARAVVEMISVGQ